jgi:glycosyltransferase involved in cell wall biosynthesis
MVNSLRSKCRLVIIDLSSGRLERSLAYHFQKIVRVLKGICIVLLNSGVGHRLYLSADSGLGLFYNLLIIAFARLARHSIFLHYHSFSFIDRGSRLMRLLVTVSGTRATHIFLCDGMRDRFKNEYPFDGLSLLCSNARFVPPKPDLRPFMGDRPLRLGLLSHLNAEKGLYDFLSLLRAVKQRKLPICGILAGPPVSAADAKAISTARQELGGYLEFRGPLYGEAKDTFYDEIDAFLFPTRFRVEAQPVVLLEALAHSVPVISYARGCIASDIKGDVGYIIPASADFVTHALAHIERWLAEPGAYEASRAAAGQLSRKLYDSAEGGFVRLLSVLTEPTIPVQRL